MTLFAPAPTFAGMDRLDLSDEEWRKRLTPEQYSVLRQAGTDPAFAGRYTDLEAEGAYRCAGCGALLFDSGTKYHSGSGWPSFTAPAAPGVVAEHEDVSHGMRRVEARCATCDGHLGHVFPDGPGPTGLRYCMNSTSLAFEPNA